MVGPGPTHIREREREKKARSVGPPVSPTQPGWAEPSLIFFYNNIII